jgi:hypothetical protein
VEDPYGADLRPRIEGTTEIAEPPGPKVPSRLLTLHTTSGPTEPADDAAPWLTGEGITHLCGARSP